MTKLSVLLLVPILGLAQDAALPSERRVQIMGTWCRLVSYAPNRPESVRETEAFLRILEETEQELSTWRPGTELDRVNRQPVGAPSPLSRSLCGVLGEVMSWSGLTDYAFDPAIGRLVDAWGLRTGGRWPSATELSDARERSGIRHVRFDAQACTVVRDTDLWVDSDAFGKGEGLDRVLTHAQREKASPSMIDLGGQVAVHGLPPNEAAWIVDIAHPVRRQEAALTVRLRAGSLSTSGGSERDVRSARGRIGHILDPRTGMPAVFGGSVSVWHERALIADILSTALFVMGPDDGLRWAEERGLAVCFLSLGEDGRLRIRHSRPFAELLL